jgi:pimeloyl-ACP methyl ester carboxylesterase
MRIAVLVFAVIAVCVVALFVNARWVDSRTRMAMARDGGQISDGGGIRTNVRVEGKDQPIVLIHGFGAAIDWWDHITPELTADHRVIRIDLIGHGGRRLQLQVIRSRSRQN